ncbi:annexin [Aquimarina sediminis]|uniref:annexin n=1 Tax=Aquimarina sediminis TaxID=2070536 RepID=UPI001F4EADB3|nr:annexin [Aquimarina sediminis]
MASGLTIGVFFLVRSLVRGYKRNHRERHALRPGNPANFATRLKMAFENDNAFGWGTDEELVFQTIELIPSISMMRKVERAYRDLYGSNLSADLKSELSSEEFAIVQQIINSKT